jgi:hypothetical protein
VIERICCGGGVDAESAGVEDDGALEGAVVGAGAGFVACPGELGAGVGD